MALMWDFVFLCLHECVTVSLAEEASFEPRNWLMDGWNNKDRNGY